MKRLQPSGPYLIVGFSSGGVVAYEMAQQLHRRGEQVSRVILVDAFAAEAGRFGTSKKQRNQFIAPALGKGLPRAFLAFRITQPWVRSITASRASWRGVPVGTLELCADPISGSSTLIYCRRK